MQYIPGILTTILADIVSTKSPLLCAFKQILISMSNLRWIDYILTK